MKLSFIGQIIMKITLIGQFKNITIPDWSDKHKTSLISQFKHETISDWSV